DRRRRQVRRRHAQSGERRRRAGVPRGVHLGQGRALRRDLQQGPHAVQVPARMDQPLSGRCLMSWLTNLLGAGDVVRAVGDSLDKLFTSDDDRVEKRLEIVKGERDFRLSALTLLEKSDEKQADVNIEEIRTGSFFMAGWRPAIGWIGVLALAYQFV